MEFRQKIMYNKNIKKVEGEHMYNIIANKLANILVSYAGDSIDSKCKNIEVVTYGIELLMSSIVNLIFVMIIGGYFFGTFATFVFVLFFCPIRQFSGGYHAKSYITCTVGFLVLFLLFGNIMMFIENTIVCFGLWLIFGRVILSVSPIDTENKRLDQKLKCICKKKIGLLLCIELVSLIVFMILDRIIFLQMAVTALGIESILLLLGKIVNQKE
jgi:accessory gene regulator B